ncbi:vacuolar protein sorting/targeting protein PEP1 [Thecaphora frezii]
MPWQSIAGSRASGRDARPGSMASRILRPMLWLSSLALVLALLAGPLGASALMSKVPQAKTTNPAVSISRFAHLPSRLAYFDDSTVVLYHDATEGNVYRSEDEGKSWKLVNGPSKGSASVLVPHPHDIKQAYILSSGNTHWRTTNRGASWQEFKTPEPPSVRSGPPLEFHGDQKHWDYIIFTGKKCTMWTPWGGAICHEHAYYTTDAFASGVKPLVEYAKHCSWAKATKDMAVHPDAMKRIFCIAWEDASQMSKWKRATPIAATTRLFESDDFFKTRKMVDLGLGRNARSFAGLGPSKKFLVTALRENQGANDSPGMVLYVTRDGVKWEKAQFPHGSELHENAYTVVDSTTHSLMVDVVDTLGSDTGVLFTSDSTGTRFVKSLEGTHRSSRGLVDFEHLQNIEGVGLANVKVDSDGSTRTVITFDDGSHWHPLRAPSVDAAGKRIGCDPNDAERCSLHLYSVTHLHNTGKVFSSTAPGFVMGVGSVGRRLLPYEECDTFLSTDAGRTWRMVSFDAHKYEFGDQGSVLVIVDDEDTTDHVSYSFNHGKDWKKLDLGVKVRAKLLTTIPDSTSLKFLLVGTQTRKEVGSQDRNVAVFLDFATMGKRKCGESDMEKWYAQAAADNSCLMGHKQWYKRRKADADCVVADKFHDPEGKEDPCPCTDADYECDFGYVRDSAGKCVATGLEKIPAGECTSPSQRTFRGSSGYRLIPGNTCDRTRGARKDDPVEKPCDQGQPEPGKVAHQLHEFPALVVDKMYFPYSSHVMVQLSDGTVWQSLNDGYSWKQLLSQYRPDDPDARIVTMALHSHDKSRGYLITAGQKVYHTTDKGVSWNWFSAPLPANGLGIPVLDFHPEKSDWLIWTGSRDCVSSAGNNCQAVAYVTQDNGRNFRRLDNYVRICAWVRGARLKADPRTIICESYANKRGNQKGFTSANPLQLISGANFYKDRTKLFDSVIGWATFEQYLIVAEYDSATHPPTMRLKVSLDGRHFSDLHFPPGFDVRTRAYTVLDSVTDSVFLHFTTHSNPGSEWGTLLKSNSNGTYFSQSLEFVNRNAKGFVDFEKMLGLDGVAMTNAVANPDDAAVSGRKDLVTKITHNDGGRWKPLTPPFKDAFGNPYECNSVGCSLHIHGFTERDDPKATFSSPSAVGLMLGVGNVGRKLAPYRDSDTFLTRDGGFTWEEVHKDAHRWEFGDQGSIIILVNDEDATDTVLYSLNEGLTWESYSFGQKLRVTDILTVPEDTHRRFILLGSPTSSSGKTLAVYLDFTALQTRKCKLDVAHPEADDFELWSPSESRQEACLFGRQTYYYKRKRQAECYVGETIVQPHEVVRNCSCTDADFECEFNHFRDPITNQCVLYPGTSALPSDEEAQCWASDSDGYWYERTNMRKIPHSSCTGGKRPDRGARHICSNNPARHGFFWWATVVSCPFALAGFVGWWWNKKQHRAGRGTIRLPDTSRYTDSEFVQNVALVPRFVLGLVSLGWSKVVETVEQLPFVRDRLRRSRGSYGGYRNLTTDEDAEILRDYEDDELER